MCNISLHHSLWVVWTSSPLFFLMFLKGNSFVTPTLGLTWSRAAQPDRMVWLLWLCEYLRNTCTLFNILQPTADGDLQKVYIQVIDSYGKLTKTYQRSWWTVYSIEQEKCRFNAIHRRYSWLIVGDCLGAAPPLTQGIRIKTRLHLGMFFFFFRC